VLENFLRGKFSAEFRFAKLTEVPDSVGGLRPQGLGFQLNLAYLKLNLN